MHHAMTWIAVALQSTLWLGQVRQTALRGSIGLSHSNS